MTAEPGHARSCVVTLGAVNRYKLIPPSRRGSDRDEAEEARLGATIHHDRIMVGKHYQIVGGIRLTVSNN